VGGGPIGIAAGDFKNFGQARDLVVANHNDNTVSILYGDGNGGFTAGPVLPVGQGPFGVATGDFNGDGKIDIAVANKTDDDVSILFGNGDGTFQAAVTLGAGGAPANVAVGNFSGHGPVDMAVANTSDDTITILLSQITQTATATASNIQISDPGTHTAAASYPGDAHFDASVSAATAPLAAAGQTATPTFSVAGGTYASTQMVTIADSTAGSTIYYTTNGTTPSTNSTMFTAPITVSSTETLQAIAVANGFAQSAPVSATYTIEVIIPTTTTLTSSANPQVVGQNVTFTAVVTPVSGGGVPTGTITATVNGNFITTVTLNNGVGTYTSDQLPVGTFSLGAVYSGDATYGPSMGTMIETVNSATGANVTLAVISGGQAVTTVSSGSVVTLMATVTNAGAPVTTGLVNFCDATVAYCTDIHLIGTAQLSSAGTAVFKFVPPPGGHSYRAAFAGTASAVAGSSNVANLTVNSAPTTTTIAQSGSAGDYTLTATVVGSGGLLAPTGTVSFLDTSNAGAVLGTATLGTGTAAQGWTTPQSPATEPEPQSVVVGDFNGDGIPDLAVGTNGTAITSGTGYVGILLGNGDGTFQAAKNTAALGNNQSIAAAAFVNGGPQDIITVSNSASGTNNADILFGNGAGGVSQSSVFSLQLNSVTSIVTGDFNGDGKQDFIVAGEIFGVYAFDIFLGNGNGTFNSGTLNATGSTPTVIAAGEFDSRGSLELVVANTSDGSITLFENDGAGNFFPNGSSASGVHPTSIVAGDFNGDGILDLAVADSAAGMVTVLIGDGFGDFTKQTPSAAGTNPASIVTGDFNGDGKLDVAVSNPNNMVTILLGKGDGTFAPATTQPTGTSPQGIAAGNFNGQGNTGLAVANLGSANAAASTVTVLLSQETQTATATANNIAVSGSGTHLVDASYPGDSTYAASVSATTGLTASGGISQTITFPAPSSPVTYGVAPITLNATGGASGNPIVFSTTGPCSVTSATLTITGVGSCVVSANQAGNATYTAAAQVSHTITISPAVLTVAVAGSPSRQFGQQNPVFTYTIGPFVNGDTQTTATTGAPSLTTAAIPKSAAGNYTITATQGTLAAVNYTFNFVNGQLTVTGGAAQTIVFSPLANFSSGTSVPLIAVASSGLAVTFTVTGPANISNGTTLNITGTGPVTVTAAQAGDGNFNPATSVARTFTAQ